MGDLSDKNNSSSSYQMVEDKITKEVAESFDKFIEDLPENGQEKARELIHELKVHYTELEMQKEELRRTFFDYQHYFDHYEHAPVGYFVLSENGLIQEANLTAATLLGVPRDQFVSQSFTRFILPEDHDRHYWFRRKLFEGGPTKTCEVRMLRAGMEPFRARIESCLGRNADGGVVCRYTVSDIAEGKQNEAAFTQQEETSRTCSEFSLLVQAIPQLVWICSADGLNTYFNQKWVDYTGLTLEESSGHGWNKPFHPDDQQVAWDAWQKAIINKVIYELECRLRRFDGVYKWWLIRGEPLCDERGSVLSWFGTCTDIDALKQAETIALRQSEEQFKTLANSIPQLCWMARADGWIFWYNDRWYDYTGTTSEQMEGWGWQTVHDAKYLSQVLAQWKASIATGEPFDMVFPLRGADGVFRLFLTRIVPVRNENGRILCWCGTNTDITEREKAEQALKESEARFRLATETANLGFFDWNTRTGETFLSSLWKKQLGYEDNEVQNSLEEFESRLHPEDRDRVLAKVGSYLATPYPGYEIEFRLRHRDGSYRTIYTRAELLADESGMRCRMLGTHLDITARKRAEMALEGSRAALSSIIESSSDWIWSVDPVSFGLTLFNTALTGYFSKNLSLDIRLGMTPMKCSPLGGELRGWTCINAPCPRDLSRRNT